MTLKKLAAVGRLTGLGGLEILGDGRVQPALRGEAPELGTVADDTGNAYMGCSGDNALSDWSRGARGGS